MLYQILNFDKITFKSDYKQNQAFGQKIERPLIVRVKTG